jgi:multicomponent Na+:H+ antiporter subunit G
VIGELLALLGATLVFVAAVGIVRFPDPLTRMHALSKASTLGILLILAGAAINLSDVNDITSVVLAALFHVLTSPPASNMVSRATYLAEGLSSDQTGVDEGAVPLRGSDPA